MIDPCTVCGLSRTEEVATELGVRCRRKLFLANNRGPMTLVGPIIS